MDRLRVNAFGQSLYHQVALDRAFYANADLEVDWGTTNASKEQMQELKDGRWEIVHTNADNVFWWVEDNGANFVIVLALPSQPGQNLIVRPEIGGYEDLRGKPIAVDAAESGYVTPLRQLLGEAGLTEEGKDFTFVQVGNTGFRIDSMRAGQTYAAMISAGQERALEPEGFKVLDNINRLYTHYAGSTAVRRDWAEANRDLLVRYLRAHLQAMRWAEDPANADELARIQGGARRRESGATTWAVPPFEWDGLQAMLETRQTVGLLRGAPDPRRFADDRYYQEALQGLDSD
jgi:ABC-type nitrate/sulfonate/bicarbonate transport system substrate-binding protein